MVAKRRRHQFQCTSTRYGGVGCGPQLLELDGGVGGSRKDRVAPVLRSQC